jgi:3-(3-hydroxy-phenyl)propionate hydroxylase
VDEIFDVAVVGYGLNVLVAAPMLGQAGRRVVVCERWPSLYGLPRLTHIDDETARVMQAAGDLDEAPRDSTPTEYLWVNGRDEQLLQMPVTPVGPMGFPTHISMHQADVEDAIDWRIQVLPTVEVWQGWSVSGLTQDADGAELTVLRVHTAYLRELGAVAYLARPDFVLFGAAIEAAKVPGPVDEVRAALAWTAAPWGVGA